MNVRQPARDADYNAGATATSGNSGRPVAGPSAGLLGPAIAVGIVFAVAGALTGLASSDDPPDADARRREIASMSRSERERLERNYQRFRDASEEDRQRLRRLGAVVRRDPALEQTLRDYTAWLDMLSPWQRQEVASSQDDARIEVIRRILADQKRQREEYEREQQRLVELFNAHRERSIPKFSVRSGYSERERLKTGDIAKAFGPLEEALPAAVRPKDDLCARDRNLAVLTVALKHYSTRPDFHDEPIPRSVLTAMIADLPDGGPKRFSENQVDKSWGPRFLTAVFIKIASENWWDDARRERRMPRSRAEIEALVAKLSPESQTEFARLESQSTEKAVEAYSRLLRAYHDLWVEEKEAEFNRRFTELREIYEMLDFRGPFPEPFGGGRPQSHGNRGDRGDRGSRGDDDRRGFHRGGRDRDHHRHDGRNGRDDRGKPSAAEEHDEPARAERPPMSSGEPSR